MRPSLLFESDALRLPVRDASLDLITVAFGFRNLANYEDGLREMRRALRPGGMAAILEFSQPPNAVFGAVYGFYSRRVLPWIGGLLTGSRDAYRYLPESIRKFPAAPQLAEDMRRAGFSNVTYQRFTGGSVALHVGAVTGMTWRSQRWLLAGVVALYVAMRVYHGAAICMDGDEIFSVGVAAHDWAGLMHAVGRTPSIRRSSISC
jgi:SAM-dependent methyltransferase